MLLLENDGDPYHNPTVIKTKIALFYLFLKSGIDKIEDIQNLGLANFTFHIGTNLDP